MVALINYAFARVMFFTGTAMVIQAYELVLGDGAFSRPVFWALYLAVEVALHGFWLLSLAPEGGWNSGGYRASGVPTPNGVPPWARDFDRAQKQTSDG